MTEWDYLRAFHARHPEAGKFESTWLERFNIIIKTARLALKHIPGHKMEYHLGEARRKAAAEIEVEYLATLQRTAGTASAESDGQSRSR